MTRRVAFLFLGETLLIPHLYPIVEALAAVEPTLPIDLWISTSIHERLLGRWIETLGPNAVRLRRAPGFRVLPGHDEGSNPPLPAKLPMLARLAPRLARTPVVVCAEQTSLWLPTLLPLRSRFIKAPHGAGSLMKRDDRRRRAAWRTLVPAERERTALAAVGIDPARIAVTGYAKAEFTHRTPAARLFTDARPIVLYNPHWQQHRSSWWRWGAETVRRIVASGRYNVIFAPHQRLVERAPEVAELCRELAPDPSVHCDFTSFATVDGSYAAAADVYLGDTSSQVVEFLIRPRPTVFLDALGADWRGNPAYDMWSTGEVVTDIEQLLPVLDRAPARHAGFAARQQALAAELLGPLDGRSAARAAAAIRAALDG
ncbi:MAG TPA: hypothetical protein VFT56_04915 [Sphingomonas sp.]|nr:hypothetical protein [Sphingomonas sp.]